MHAVGISPRRASQRQASAEDGREGGAKHAVQGGAEGDGRGEPEERAPYLGAVEGGGVQGGDGGHGEAGDQRGHGAQIGEDGGVVLELQLSDGQQLLIRLYAKPAEEQTKVRVKCLIAIKLWYI
jgi:hypothetical protein